jgi:hypothetical protein
MTGGSNEGHSDPMEESLCEADGLLAGPKMFRGFMEHELTLSEETATGRQPEPDESFRAPLGYILIFSSHLLLDLADVPSFFPVRTPYVFLTSNSCYISCLYCSSFYHPHNIWRIPPPPKLLLRCNIGLSTFVPNSLKLSPCVVLGVA